MGEAIGITAYAAPAFLLLMLVEFLGDRRDEDSVPQRGFALRDTGCNVGFYLLGRITEPAEKLLALPLVVGAAALAPVTLSASHWWVWVAAIVLVDLAYYWHHRLCHRVRLFWAGHSAHHSSEHYNLSTALRQQWLIPGAFLTSVVYVPVVLIGIPAWMIFAAQSLALIWQYPIHTQRIGRLPAPLEFVFNTPSHHRVHHGANNAYLDKNYGGLLIVWDRLFGSYADEVEPVRFGLTTNIVTHNPVKANYHEFVAMLRDIRDARDWRGRLGYLVRPPGWTEPAIATVHTLRHRPSQPAEQPLAA